MLSTLAYFTVAPPAIGEGRVYVHWWEDCSRSCTVTSEAMEPGIVCRNSLCFSGAQPCISPVLDHTGAECTSMGAIFHIYGLIKAFYNPCQYMLSCQLPTTQRQLCCTDNTVSKGVFSRMTTLAETSHSSLTIAYCKAFIGYSEQRCMQSVDC